MKGEYDAIGTAFDPGPERVERLAEAVRIIRGLLSGEDLTFEGRHYRVHGVEEFPRPLQRPHPPILIGGGGRKLLSMAAREAQIVSIVPRVKAEGTGLDADDVGSRSFAEKLAWVREAAGARLAGLELNTLIQSVVVGGPRAGAELMARRWDVTPDWVLDSPYALVGEISDIEDRLLEMREVYGVSYITVFEEALDEFAGVVARLAST
jgi:probable F420-dependent oxidoreductase